MSGTDPKGKWFGKKADPTQPFAPDGAEANHTLPGNLPKIPGITLQYEIARGGMGVVYSGRQDFLDRRVAVKFLSVDLGGDSFAQRFQREAKILAGINHPNIVGCFMADTTPEGQSYLVMEFIDGPSLKAWIQDNGAIAPMAALRLIRATANALSHAHQSDIIHRDVKPENVLLESATSSALDINFPFLPKVVDLGLARMTHDQVGAGLTSPGSVMGTPATMSPEQFDDPDSVDFRSDIYGLGCCLYEMLVGQPAFRGQKLTEIVVRKREPCAPNPCDENPNIPAAVGSFTQRLLACDREDRPASYKELDREADELMQALITDRASKALGQSGETGLGATGLGATVVSKPGVPAPNQPTKTAPGMLNTGELDFLSEGGGIGGEAPAAPAFQEAGGGAGAGGASTSATKPSSGGRSGSKKGLVIGVTIAALAAAGAGVMLGMGDDEKDPAGGGGAPSNNATPKIDSIQLRIDGADVADSQATVDLGAQFELVASASDADGDELEYEWQWPTEVMHPVTDTRSKSVRFELDDGLPGVEHTVALQVSDDKALPVSRSYQIKVGECEETMPLIGFESRPEWTFDKKAWVENIDPLDRHWRGRSLSKVCSLSTNLGTEPFWEWHGNLSSEENRNESFATLGLRFEIGDQALAVRCRREEKGDLWKIELVEAVQADGRWDYRPLPEVCEVAWRHGDGKVDYRGWFSVQRRGGELAVRIAEAYQPLEGELGIKSPQLRKIPLVDGDSPVRLTLFVDEGIGRFRVKTR